MRTLRLLLALALVGRAISAFTCGAGDDAPSCSALGDLWTATLGGGWTTQTGWATAAVGTATSYCSFAGIGCSASVVTSLSLPSNGLTGTLPASLSNLVGLSLLNLSHNLLSGTVPRSFAALYRPCVGMNLVNGTGNNVTGCMDRVNGTSNVVSGMLDFVLGDNNVIYQSNNDSITGSRSFILVGSSDVTVGSDDITQFNSNLDTVIGNNDLIEFLTNGSFINGSHDMIHRGTNAVSITGSHDVVQDGATSILVVGSSDTLGQGAFNLTVIGSHDVLQSAVASDIVVGSHDSIHGNSVRNQVYGSSDVVQNGVHDNVVQGSYVTVQDGAYSNQVSGSHNVVEDGSHNNFVNGTFDTVQRGVFNNSITGSHDVVEDGSQSNVIVGDSNVVQYDALYDTVVGNGNTVQQSAHSDTVIGNSNVVLRHASRNIVNGNSNILVDSASSDVVAGNQNVIQRGAWNVSVSGSHNIVQSDATSDVLVGSSDLLQKGVKHDTLTGNHSAFQHNSQNGTITGNYDDVYFTNNTVVTGAYNWLYNTTGTLKTITGSYNNVSNNSAVTTFNLTGSSDNVNSDSAAVGSIDFKISQFNIIDLAGNNLVAGYGPGRRLSHLTAHLVPVTDPGYVSFLSGFQADLSGNNLTWTCDTGGQVGPVNDPTVCAALQSLYRSNGATSLAAMDAWPTRNYCTANMSAIGCSFANGNISTLALTGLSGVLPSGLRALVSLQTLNITASTLLPLDVTSTLAGMISLTALNVGSSGVCGVVPAGVSQAGVAPLPFCPVPTACADVAHRFSANALSGVYTVGYDDSGQGSGQGSPWQGIPLRAQGGAATTLNDYGYTHTLLTGDSYVSGSELYDPVLGAWRFDGLSGIGMSLPTSPPATLGSAASGLSIGLWFLTGATWGARNQGHNVLLSASARNVSLRLVFTAGIREQPRLSLKIARELPGAVTSTTSSDYAVSDSDFEAQPNLGGSADWALLHSSRTWQHVVLTFDGTGALASLFWNGQRQTAALPTVTPSLGPLPFGPLASFSLGFDGGRIGFEKGTASAVKQGGRWMPKWRRLADFQGAISDLSVYDYALTGTQVRGLYSDNTTSCPTLPPPSPPGGQPTGGSETISLCLEGYAAASLTGALPNASLANATSAYFNLTSTPVNVTDGCADPTGTGRRLATAAPRALITFLTLYPSDDAYVSLSALLRALDAPATSPPCQALLAYVQNSGLSASIGIWLAPASQPPAGTLQDAAANLTDALSAPQPPSPPPSPPNPPLQSAPPGALGGYGGATNRHYVAPSARSAGAVIGYAIAAVVVLWLPVHMIVHALTAGHVRRTCVSFAVALQCEAVLEHGLSDVHGSPKHAPAPAEADADDESFGLLGRRFGANGLAAATEAFFASAAAANATVTLRPLIRSPLLNALGAQRKGGEAGSLVQRKKPTGLFWRLKRALQSELDWHRRAARHTVRTVRRALTPRKGGQPAGAGRVFRLAPAGAWLADDVAPHTCALFEVCVSFGMGGRSEASAFRASLRDGSALGRLESAFSAQLSADEKAHVGAGLGVRLVGAVILTLLDDQPHSRLDAKSPVTLKFKLPETEVDASGLSLAVRTRLATLLQLCLKDKDAIAALRQHSTLSLAGAFVSAPSTPKEGPSDEDEAPVRSAAISREIATAAAYPVASPTAAAAADVPPASWEETGEVLRSI